MPTSAQRDISCGLFGHTLEEYIMENGKNLRRLQDHQRTLYRLVAEQIGAGMQHFYTVLTPGAALWMADYVLLEDRAMSHLNLQLHILADKEPVGDPEDLAERVYAQASTRHILQTKHKADSFRWLMQNCSRILFIERYEGHDVLCSYAESEGVEVIRHTMPNNLPCTGKSIWV